MTFKREISIDGVAVITSAIALTVFLANMKSIQDAQGKEITKDENRMDQMMDTQQQMASSIAVLTTLVNERTVSRQENGRSQHTSRP